MVEAQKPDIIARLKERYGIQLPAAIPNFQIPLSLLLVDDVSRLLQDFKVASVTPIAQTGTGVKDFRTVPDGKRWTLFTQTLRRITGDRNSQAFHLYDPREGASIIIDEYTATDYYKPELYPIPIVLEEGWIIQADVTGGSTDGNWTWVGYYAEENAF